VKLALRRARDQIAVLMKNALRLTTP